MEIIKVETLLRVGWIAGIIPIIIASLPFSLLNSFHHILLVFAGRGKTLQSSSFFSFIGFSFYTAAPLSLFCNCAPKVFTFVANRGAEFIMKGNNHMPPYEFQWFEHLNPLLNLGWFQWVGAIIFFYGWLHQRRCHSILGNLQKVKEQVNVYKIPYGDWFDIVSSAHYLAEIVIYGGLVVASGGQDLTVWLLFAFVVVNLVFAAAETHRWYQRKLDNYPSNRYAIIPFVY